VVQVVAVTEPLLMTLKELLVLLTQAAAAVVAVKVQDLNQKTVDQEFQFLDIQIHCQQQHQLLAHHQLWYQVDSELTLGQEMGVSLSNGTLRKT
jgi:hypothetical protein